MGIRGYVAKRLLSLIPVIIGVITLTFLISHVIPADPAIYWAGGTGVSQLPARSLELARARYHLDEPLYVQYYYYMAGMLRGDLGVSPVFGRPVAEMIAYYLPNTIELALTASLITTILGILIGVSCAVNRDGIIDHIGRFFFMAGLSVPSFWLGIILQMVFYYYLKIVPSPIGRLSPTITVTNVTNFLILDSLITGNWLAFFNALQHLALPAIALSMTSLGFIIRLTRASMLEVLSEEFVRTSRAMGLRKRLVVYKYALRAALIPPVAAIGWTIGSCLGGAALIEVVFAWPGVGWQVVQSVQVMDYPLLNGFVLVSGIVFSVVNLSVDVLYYYIDPRIRR